MTDDNNMCVFLTNCSVPSTAGSQSALDVTTSVNPRPVSSAVDNTSTLTLASQGSISNTTNCSDVNVWPTRETDEQLRQAVEMSELLTISK